MKQFFQSNWREVISMLLVIVLLILGVLALQSSAVSESAEASTALSVIIQLLGGVVKFIVCLGLTWFGLLVTLPEANRFVVSRDFDKWWTELFFVKKGYVALAAAGVIGVMAALCLSV